MLISANQPTLPARDEQPATSGRLFFVDNLRVFLTILVLIFHVMVIYAALGGWQVVQDQSSLVTAADKAFYYVEGRADLITAAIGAWFLATNQAYFMGLFVLISAYFVLGSHERKGHGRFVKDRLVRLGIPLAVYSWIVSPLLVYLDRVLIDGLRTPIWRFITEEYIKTDAVLGGGPLWFVEALLLFTGGYVIWRLIGGRAPVKPQAQVPFPHSGWVALFAVGLGLVGFLVRLWRPVGWHFTPLNLQFPFFAQYIALFILGLIAYRRNWLLTLPDKTGVRWLILGIGLVLIFPLLALIGGAANGGIDVFTGGWHWQALVYALWESFLCVAVSIGLIYAFRRYANRQGRLTRHLARGAYTVYIIHAIVITGLAYAIRGVDLHPLLKFGVVSLIGVPLCFALSALITRIPYADRVL